MLAMRVLRKCVEVAEQADATDLKSVAYGVRVQVPPSTPKANPAIIAIAGVYFLSGKRQAKR